MSIWTGAFWKAATERAIRTAAQTFVALVGVNVGVNAGQQVGLFDIDWAQVTSVTALAVVLSYGTAIATSGVGGNGPGITEEVVGGE